MVACQFRFQLCLARGKTELLGPSLTRDIDREKKYHSSIKTPLITKLLMTLRSASFFSSADKFFSRAILLSSNVFLLRFFCFWARSSPVKPISSSSRTSSSLKLSLPEPSLLEEESPGRLLDSPCSFGSSSMSDVPLARELRVMGLPGRGIPMLLGPPIGFIKLLFRRR